MTFTGLAATLPEWEQGAILAAGRIAGVDARFLAAIRIAEQGGPGREFGVLSVPARTYYDQLAVAAQSVKNAIERYRGGRVMEAASPDGRLTAGFIRAFADRWAPGGALNDPGNLNAHWVKNVTAAYTGSDVA